MRYQNDNTAVINRVRDPITTLFDSIFGTALPEFAPTEFSPRTNIVETDQAYVLAFEVPGLEEKDIRVDLRENQLLITGERKDDRETEGKTWHRVEHRYGTMTRTIALPPDAKTDGIEAVCKRGILTVTVPKLQPVEPTKIEIKAE
ncbi:MAG TPA: Hsp20/alpha crystallin family protein [Planctomycetota bacterium]|nr:Hsp20/alpha crystallin family protein [Planctomycetota bacterium]